MGCGSSSAAGAQSPRKQAPGERPDAAEPVTSPVPDLTGDLDVDAWEQRHRYMSREAVDTYFEEEFDTEALGQQEIASAFGRMTSSVVSLVKWPSRKMHEHSREHLERLDILSEATEFGLSEEGKALSSRHLVIIYNPVSGAGIAKKLVDNMVVPVLTLCGTKFSIVATECRGFAIDYMLKLDVKSVDGVLIAGGDGLVHEVVTGLMRRPDATSLTMPVGLVPSGTANAMAHELHSHSSKTHIALVGRAALAAARGRYRDVDVICTSINDKPSDNIYALSVMGWGMAGTVAKVADRMRWLPGQKRFRYDIAGFVSMIKDWPPICKAKLSFPLGNDGKWKEEDLSCINFTATNVPWLGVDHPITNEVSPDDGFIVVTWVPSTVSRVDVIKMGMGMKSGKFLGENKISRTIKVPEFKLQVEQGNSIDFNIDGDPLEPCDVHVKVLHKGIRVFAEPKESSGPLMVKKVKRRFSFVPPKASAAPMPAPLRSHGSTGSVTNDRKRASNTAIAEEAEGIAEES